jgi:hypothetical protein
MSNVEILGKPIICSRKISLKGKTDSFKPIDKQDEDKNLKLDLIYERDEIEADENF